MRQAYQFSRRTVVALAIWGLICAAMPLLSAARIANARFTDSPFAQSATGSGPVVLTGHSLDAEAATLRTGLLNTGDQSITAVAFELLTTYADGTRTRSRWQLDCYMALLYDSPPPEMDVVRPKESREYVLQLPVNPSVPIVDAVGNVLAVVLMDGQAFGAAETIQEIFAARRQDRDARRERLAQFEQFAKGRAPQQALEAMRRSLETEARTTKLDSNSLTLLRNVETALDGIQRGVAPAAIVLEQLLDLTRRTHDLAAAHAGPVAKQD
jgi:hypothetical protein